MHRPVLREVASQDARMCVHLYCSRAQGGVYDSCLTGLTTSMMSVMLYDFCFAAPCHTQLLSCHARRVTGLSVAVSIPPSNI